jgi:hypothetical protein
MGDRDHLLEVLDRTEARLDPSNPHEGGRVTVVGYGEISAALEIADLPSLVCKRMSGFSGASSVSAYLDLVGTYIDELESAGVRVAPTTAVPVRRPGRHPVVYLVQPRLAARTLGNSLLGWADDGTVAAALRLALDAVARLARGNHDRPDGIEVALDAQLSNWSFPDVTQVGRPLAGGAGAAQGTGGSTSGGSTSAGTAEPQLAEPILIDIGTPFMRREGRHAMDREVLLAPVPPGLRAFYRRKGLVEEYLDDYFVPRTVALDLLGNFHKEGASERLGLGEGIVNEWLATADIPGPRDPIHVTEVAEYYRKDAELLALYLRLRRMDRFLQMKLMRREYDYVLPGPVAR